MAPKTVVLVHGAWHGAWCWDLVSRRLDAHGITNVAVDNPSVAQAPADLAADGDNLARVLDAVDGPVLLVGHSYGGAVITDAGVHPKVERLLYVTAFALDDGESVEVSNLSGGNDVQLSERLRPGNAVIDVDRDRARQLLFHDCDAAVAADAVAKLRPMSAAAIEGVPRRIAWREKPATYVVCMDDRLLPVALQQSNAKRIGIPIEMRTGHSPFLARPDDLAAVIVELSA
jgi:pimeloyl-ACP methyl ester carboxylesterase